MADRDGIRNVDIKTDGNGRIVSVQMAFGPHFYLEVSNTPTGASFIVGATHHGFKADASVVGGQLEKIIDEVRRTQPDCAVD